MTTTASADEEQRNTAFAKALSTGFLNSGSDVSSGYSADNNHSRFRGFIHDPFVV